MNIYGQNSMNNKSCRPGFKISDGKTKCSRDFCTHPVDDPRAMICNDAREIPDGGMGKAKPDANDASDRDQNERTCKTVKDCYKEDGWSCHKDAACKCIQNKCETKTTDNCENDNVCLLNINITMNLSFCENTNNSGGRPSIASKLLVGLHFILSI